MNNELSKLFGRNYVVSFFLPAFFLLACLYLSLKAVGTTHRWLHIDVDHLFEGSALFALETFALGVFLQSINRELFRMVEGYWFDWAKDKFYEPGNNWVKTLFDDFPDNLITQLERAATGLQKRQFTEDRDEIRRLKGLALAEEGETFPESAALTALVLKAARRFPSKLKLVLPTSFGNVVRAYEDYPRVIYGIESIDAWARLEMLMPKEMTNALETTRARLDMWLNLVYVWAAMAVLNGILYCCHEKPVSLIYAGLAAVFSWYSYCRATNGAEQYGDRVKAVFDLLLPKLCRKLGFTLSADPKKNWKFWRAYSQVIVFRDDLSLIDMNKAGLKRDGVETDLDQPAQENEPEYYI